MFGIANRQRTEQQGKDPFSLFWSFPEMPRGLGTQIPLTLSGMLARTRGDARPANIRGAQAVVFGLAQLCRPLLRRLATYSARPRASLPACIPLGYSAADAMLRCWTPPRFFREQAAGFGPRSSLVEGWASKAAPDGKEKKIRVWVRVFQIEGFTSHI